MGQKEDSAWSEWLDFESNAVDTVPEGPGVFAMHASMKILFVGASQNTRQALLQALTDPCTSKAKRFRYILTNKYEQKKEQLLAEYAEKHSGQLPPCMQNG